MRRAIQPVLPYQLLQGIRLAHALTEADVLLSVPALHADKFAAIEENFGVQIEVQDGHAVEVDVFGVDHATPVTSVGSIRRPLIFPHQIVRRCRCLWDQEARTLPLSFAGLVTPARKALLSEYCARNFDEDAASALDDRSFLYRLSQRLRAKLGLSPTSHSVQVGPLTLWSSRRGRTFPVKAWDEEYYRLLARSRFTLCPSGDYVWTYRFFESMLCGAIPIVEASCEAYDGFTFHTMDEDFDRLEWDPEVALRNARLCAERVTVPVDELNAELDKLIRQAAGP